MPLFLVAAQAGRDTIGMGGTSAPDQRNNVIHGEGARVLAGAAVGANALTNAVFPPGTPF